MDLCRIIYCNFVGTKTGWLHWSQLCMLCGDYTTRILKLLVFAYVFVMLPVWFLSDKNCFTTGLLANEDMNWWPWVALNCTRTLVLYTNHFLWNQSLFEACPSSGAENASFRGHDRPLNKWKGETPAHLGPDEKICSQPLGHSCSDVFVTSAVLNVVYRKMCGKWVSYLSG